MMPEKLILPNEFLKIAEEELKEGRSVRILADGKSMYPFIHGGQDIAEIEPLGKEEELVKWRAYFFRWKGNYIIHRFLGEENGEYIMLGDGNLKYEERPRREDIIGVLNRLHRQDGSVIDCAAPRWKRNGKIWNKLLPLRRYLLALARRMSRYGITR